LKKIFRKGTKDAIRAIVREVDKQKKPGQGGQKAQEKRLWTVQGGVRWKRMGGGV